MLESLGMRARIESAMMLLSVALLMTTVDDDIDRLESGRETVDGEG